MKKISDDLADKIYRTAQYLEDVPQVDDSTGVQYWEDGIPGCFFCNAVRAGVMTEGEADQYQFTYNTAWDNFGFQREKVRELLYMLGDEPETGLTYTRKAAAFLEEFGHPYLAAKLRQEIKS